MKNSSSCIHIRNVLMNMRRPGQIETENKLIIANANMIPIFQHVPDIANQLPTIDKDAIGAALVVNNVVTIFMLE